MLIYLLIGLLVVVAIILLVRGERSLCKESSTFKLYLVFIDLAAVPELANSILQGNVPQSMTPAFITYVPERIRLRKGLKADQIVGFLIDYKKGFVPHNFVSNRAFKDKFHFIAASEIPESFLKQAESLGEGEIRLIDERIGSQADADEWDCIGRYKVRSGQVVGYLPNPDFRLLSFSGPLELVEPIRKALFSELSKSKPADP